MNFEKTTRIRAQLLQKFPDFPIPEKSYLVIYSARSGSNLLCKYLSSAQIGQPIEAFNPSRHNQKRLNWEIDYNDPIAHLSAAIRHQTFNNIMGMKLSIPHSTLLFQAARTILDDKSFDLSEAELLEVFFPSTRYIHIQRKDKVKQAISFSKAKQNGVWFENVDEDPSYRDYLVSPVYSQKHIEASFDELLMEDSAWSHFLDENQLPVFHVWYEDLIRDPVQVLSEVCQFLEVKNQVVAQPLLKKQSNKLSKNWEQRFRSETPWLQEEKIRTALENGDLKTLAIRRSVMLTNQIENKIYFAMPAIKFKPVRKLFVRLRQKLKSVLRLR